MHDHCRIAVLPGIWAHVLSFLAALIAMSGVGPRSVAADLRPEEIYRQTLPSVMTLTVEAKGGTKFVGTAFLALREGLALTAWHLVRDAKNVTARFADGTELPVDGVTDWNEQKDIALLRLEVTDRPLINLASEAAPIGARACVVGAPRGFEFSISDGLVSQVQLIDGFHQYQVSCPISPGNSGGPVLNLEGPAFGVVAWSEKDAQNLNFATPSSCVLELNPSLPTIAWKALPKSKRVRSTARQTQPARDALRELNRNQNLAAFQKYLSECGGRRVAIVVTDPSGEKSFSFVVPKDFGK